MKLDQYVSWARGEVDKDPAVLTKGWADGWKSTLGAIRTASAVYEHTAIIVARWEFLGSLYRGTHERNTDFHEAVLYAKKFLPAYDALHDLSGANDGRSEFFSMLRNKPLHGYTPAGVLLKSDEVVGWSISAQPHLGKNGDGSLCIDSAKLEEDFIKSVAEFASFLNTNANDTAANAADAAFTKLPQERWKRGLWMRFNPINCERTTWTSKGAKLGLFSKP